MEQAKRIMNHEALDKEAVCYWKVGEDWLIYLPHCGIGSLVNHTVQVHQEGTITVSPSILMNGHDEAVATQRHGHLVWGRWQECSGSSFYVEPS